MKGVLFIVASLVAFATGQDCPAYYVRSQSGQSCYRYFNMRVPYRMASEFCEMVTPCGNGPAQMGALASVSSPQENMEIYQLVAGFSQDNQMENEIWLGWNSQSPFFWEDGTPAYPNGFSAFGSSGVVPPRPGAPPSRGWPVNPQNPMSGPPGRAPVMKRQNPPTRPGQGGRQIPQGVGPQWEVVEVTAMRAFVCEVAAGRNIPAGQQPGMGPGMGMGPGGGGRQPGFGQQPGMGGRQPGTGGWQPGMGGQQPGMGGRQPGMGGQQPGMGGRQPGMGGQQPGMGGRQPGMGGQQPGMGGRQPGMGGQQPGMGGRQPGMGGQQPGMGGRQPGMGGQQPGMGGRQPGMGGQQPNNPNPRFNRPRMLQKTDVFA